MHIPNGHFRDKGGGVGSMENRLSTLMMDLL